MQPDSPYRLVEALGSSQVGSVWTAVDAEGRPLTVAVLDASVALDQQWRDAFAAAANALAQPQAGGPRVLYTDFAAPSPWVACAAEGGPGAEQVFLALGVTYQPVPPDFGENGNSVTPVPQGATEPETEQQPAISTDVPAADGETTQPTEKIPFDQLPPVNPWATPPHPVSPSPQPYPAEAHPQPISAPPDSVSGTPYAISGPPQQMSVPPDVVSSVPLSPGPIPHSPAYGPLPPDGPSQYPPYYPANVAPSAAAPRRRHTGLWVGVGALVLLLIAGGGAAFALRGGGGEPDITSTTGAALPPMPTSSPVSPGVEPPKAGAWPTQWPNFDADDSVRTYANLEGLSFPLKVPQDWTCAPAGRAQGYVKYTCGAHPGTPQEIGGEIVVRDCTQPCSEAEQTTMREAEEAWGARWVRSGQYSTYAEAIINVDGQQRHGVVVVAYFRSGDAGAVDRQLVFRMTSPVTQAPELRRIATYLRTVVVF